MIVIVDLTLGNLFNVKRAIEHVGGEAIISDNIEIIRNAEKIVLPGVGSYKAGMKSLIKKGLVPCLKERASAGTSLLGICLGMQLFMDESDENGLTTGLGLIPGRVVHFRQFKNFDKSCKVPNIGWASLFKDSYINLWENTILHNLNENEDSYFVHSYCVLPQNTEDTLAFSYYGGSKYCAVIKRDNITGCQFHPEKSGDVGLKIINSFVNNHKQEIM